jgi:hypothetical protein
MKRLIGVLLALGLLASVSGAAATPKVEPVTLTAQLAFWGIDPNAPYPKLTFPASAPWMGWVGTPVQYIYSQGGCGQKIGVFIPACTGCPSTCPAGRSCSTAVAEGVKDASGVYRVLRFNAGDAFWGWEQIPYTYDPASGVLTLTLPDVCS